MKVNHLEVNMYKALAHPLRLSIIKRLYHGSLCVCELNEDTEHSQASISQHLKVLKDADLLETEKDGLRIYYSIKHEEIKEVVEIIEKLIVNGYS